MNYSTKILLISFSLLAQQSMAQNLVLPELVGVTNNQAANINNQKSPSLVGLPNTNKLLPQLSSAQTTTNSYKNNPEMIGINPSNYAPMKNVAVPRLLNKSEVQTASATNNSNSLGKPLNIDGRNQKQKK